MLLNKDFEELFHHLNTAHTKFLVVGAYAVIFYTEPRYTKDIDLWIKPDPQNAGKVYEALKKFGAPVHDISVNDLCNPKTVYQIGVEPNRVDVLTDIEGVSFKEAWKNKKTYHYGRERIYLLNLKDVIRAKRKAGRPKDKRDLEKLLKVVKRKKK